MKKAASLEDVQGKKSNNDDQIKKWQTWIDERIREVIGDGNVSHLANAGKPFDWNAEGTDVFTPEEMRLAYKVMKDNDTIPTWMALRYVLEDQHNKIIKRLKRFAKDYQTRLTDARKKSSFVLEREAHQRWQSALERLQEEIDKYNGEILNYNLSVPPQIQQKIPLDLHQLVATETDIRQ